MGNILTGHKVIGRTVCHAQDQRAIMTWAFKCTAHTGLGAGLSSMAATFGVTYAAALKAAMYNGATFKGSGAVNLSEDPILDEVRDATNAGIGTAGDDPLPLDTCGLIRKRTGVRGHKGRGRAYIPFPAVDDQDTDGTPLAAYVTKLNALKPFWLTPIVLGGGGNTSSMTPCLVNQALGEFTPIIETSSVKLWANQHRRGSFGKQNPDDFAV